MIIPGAADKNVLIAEQSQPDSNADAFRITSPHSFVTYWIDHEIEDPDDLPEVGFFCDGDNGKIFPDPFLRFFFLSKEWNFDLTASNSEGSATISGVVQKGSRVTNGEIVEDDNLIEYLAQEMDHRIEAPSGVAAHTLDLITRALDNSSGDSLSVLRLVSSGLYYENEVDFKFFPKLNKWWGAGEMLVFANLGIGEARNYGLEYQDSVIRTHQDFAPGIDMKYHSTEGCIISGSVSIESYLPVFPL